MTDCTWKPPHCALRGQVTAFLLCCLMVLSRSGRTSPPIVVAQEWEEEEQQQQSIAQYRRPPVFTPLLVHGHGPNGERGKGAAELSPTRE